MSHAMREKHLTRVHFLQFWDIIENLHEIVLWLEQKRHAIKVVQSKLELLWYFVYRPPANTSNAKSTLICYSAFIC